METVLQKVGRHGREVMVMPTLQILHAMVRENRVFDTNPSATIDGLQSDDQPGIRLAALKF